MYSLWCSTGTGRLYFASTTSFEWTGNDVIAVIHGKISNLPLNACWRWAFDFNQDFKSRSVPWGWCWTAGGWGCWISMAQTERPRALCEVQGSCHHSQGAGICPWKWDAASWRHRETEGGMTYEYRDQNWKKGLHNVFFFFFKLHQGNQPYSFTAMPQCRYQTNNRDVARLMWWLTTIIQRQPRWLENCWNTLDQQVVFVLELNQKESLTTVPNPLYATLDVLF